MTILLCGYQMSDKALTAIAKAPDRVLMISPWRSPTPLPADVFEVLDTIHRITEHTGRPVYVIQSFQMADECDPLASQRTLVVPKISNLGDLSTIPREEMAALYNQLGCVPILLNPSLAEYVTGSPPRLRHDHVLFLCERAFSWCGKTAFGPGDPEWYLYDTETQEVTWGPVFDAVEVDDSPIVSAELPNPAELLRSAMLTNGHAPQVIDAAVQILLRQDFDPLKELCGCLST